MKRIALSLVFLTACLAPAMQLDPLDERLDLACQAWDGGDYIKALEEFEAVLKSPGGDRFFDRIALVTGELYQTVEITVDGRSARFDPSGRLIAYDAGTRAAPVSRILAADNPGKVLVEVRSASLVFSPAPNMAAFFRIHEVPEIQKLRKEVEYLQSVPPSDRRAFQEKLRQLTWFEAKNSDAVLLDIMTRKEKKLKPDMLLKTSPAFSADGREIYFVGAKESDTAACDIYAVSEAAPPRPLTSGPGFKADPIAVPGGKYLIYSITTQNPFPRPAEPGQGGRPDQDESGGRPASPRQFTVLSLADGTSRVFSGGSPSISADGSALVFINREGNETSLQLLKLGAVLSPVTLKKTLDRIGSAALTADGSGVVFDMTYTRNGEIFTIKSDGKGEARVSREIQPDRAPRFLTLDLVLAVKGEPRHSRAYLYDLTTLTAARVFHNNTLRTIAPEYEWAADPSGTHLLIQAERDGDTISAERGVYLVDLTRKITMDTLLARLRDNLEEERALRSRGEKMFAPIAAGVKSVTQKISITKIFEYEEKLFNFDSKHISQPGNKPAGDYIYQTLKSFGYQPEYQWFNARVDENQPELQRSVSREIKTANILATLPGTETPDLIYVLSAHYDSNRRGPGADDNSSSTAALLETARVLARSPQPSTIVFAAFTGEEAGLLGSREFVRQAQEKKWHISADLNNDMIGWTNDHRLDNTIRYSNAGIRDIQHAASFLFSKMITYDAHYVKSTDAAAFYSAYGDVVGGFGSYPVLSSPYYHQPTDLLENVNHRLVEETARATTASIMMLASSPAPVKSLKAAVRKDGSVHLIWEPNLEMNITSYVVEYGLGGGLPAGSLTVSVAQAVIPGIKLKKGETLSVAVKAVNALGVSGWDWARTIAVSGK